MKRKSKKYPHATSYLDRHRKRRWRFRKGRFSAELGTDYASDEFERRYQAALDGSKSKHQIGAGRVVPGSLDDLVAHFYKLHFPTIEEATRADYRSVIEPLRFRHGKKRVAHLKVRHIMAIKAEMHETPVQANKTLKRLSQMMDLAVKMEWVNFNPVKGVENTQRQQMAIIHGMRVRLPGFMRFILWVPPLIFA